MQRSGPTRRKNGKEASCEPCRKSRIRCDHSRPICTRCRQRSLHSQCYYHPAPMARKTTPTVRPEPGPLPSPASLPLQPLERPIEPRDPPSTAIAAVSPSILEVSSLKPTKRSRGDYILVLGSLLRQLQACQKLQDLMESYYPVSQSTMIPGALILRGLFSDATAIASRAQQDESGLQLWAGEVLQSTSQRVKITAFLTPSNFMALFSGDNLRLEYLGFMFSIAARSSLIGPTKDDPQKKTFISEMYRCSTTCLQLARELTPVNDMMIWLGQDHGMLTASLEGDSSEQAWRCLGDLNLDIFALGINSEAAVATDTPLFVAECRRRTFARAYHIDKYMAMLLDRPPRLLRSRATTQLPLDISDQELLADDGNGVFAYARLTPDGWSDRGFNAATWARVRSITAEMTEGILQYRYMLLDTDSVVTLREMAQRNREIWDALPSRIKYHPQCWSSLDPQDCYMLSVIILGYLETELQIFQLLEQTSTDAAHRHIVAASEVVALILELGSNRRKAFYLHTRFSYVLLYHGLAPAIVLAKALARSGQGGPTLPPTLQRSTLIKQLSAFISQLESIAGPGEPNYDICSQTVHLISSTLEDALDSSTPAVQATAAGQVETRAEVDMSNFAQECADVWAEFDLDDWMRSIDWSAGHDEWSAY